MKVMFMLVLGLGLYAARLTVVVEGIENSKGELFVGLYNDKAHFTEVQKAYKGVSEPITGKKMKVVFEALPEGVYAISVFHDENANKEIDTNFFGIPSEGFGFSNNPDASFSKPTFEESAFSIHGNTSLMIRLEY